MGRTVLRRYERIAFEKALLSNGVQPSAAFVCPGHPLLDAVIDATLEGNSNLLRQGTVLVDDQDAGTEPRVLFSWNTLSRTPPSPGSAGAGLSPRGSSMWKLTVAVTPST